MVWKFLNHLERRHSGIVSWDSRGPSTWRESPARFPGRLFSDTNSSCLNWNWKCREGDTQRSGKYWSCSITPVPADAPNTSGAETPSGVLNRLWQVLHSLNMLHRISRWEVLNGLIRAVENQNHCPSLRGIAKLWKRSDGTESFIGPQGSRTLLHEDTWT